MYLGFFQTEEQANQAILNYKWGVNPNRKDHGMTDKELELEANGFIVAVVLNIWGKEKAIDDKKTSYYMDDVEVSAYVYFLLAKAGVVPEIIKRIEND